MIKKHRRSGVFEVNDYGGKSVRDRHSTGEACIIHDSLLKLQHRSRNPWNPLLVRREGKGHCREPDGGNSDEKVRDIMRRETIEVFC